MEIIELLRKAKELYIKEQGKTGMCWCIKVIANEGKTQKEIERKGMPPYKVVVAQIPEFNPDFLEGGFHELTTRHKGIDIGLCFWWDLCRVRTRVNAFDKLIEIYENSNKEFIW